MIKRFGVLFSSEVRRRMESDRAYRNSMGVQEAVRCAQAMLSMSLCPLKRDYVSINRHRGLAKYFDGGHGAHSGLMRWFRVSARVQAVLVETRSDLVELRMMFFGAGEKKSFASMFVCFEVQTGHVVSLGAKQMLGRP